MSTTGLASSGALLLAGTLLLVLNPLPHALAKKTLPGMSPTDNLSRLPNRNTGICRSKDLRNTLNSLNELKGCRVVEGFVQILLFDNVNESSFDNHVFPELVEITDFLLLYRVNGLRSIGQLFPNLAVIRGQEKVFGYSFVVYEMSSLQEIGLYSLTNITSGLIRIDKNPSLCYVNSIDWNRIAHEKGEHFIKNIKAENECPLCRGDDSNENPCPNIDNKSHTSRHLCWNRQHCQKICPDECIACDNNGNCCDEKCLGGCSDEDPKACHVCRDFSMESKCMDTCPNGRYEFLGRRCITREECINAAKPLQLYSKVQHEHPYKIFQNKSCVLGCPTDYTDDYVKHTCEPCDGITIGTGRCTKECQGTVIDSPFSAQQLQGCTHINGSLEIQIRGGRNVVNELEENLSMIEEIDGYLKIVRSFPLVSLHFFKKLKYIRGNSLESQKYVFIILDNQNLQDIWDWEGRTLKIDHGRLFFHFNPRLCMNKIELLREKANLTPFTNLEVAPNSNGDKIACNVEDLSVNISAKHSKSIVLTWPQFGIKDTRKLLGYVVYTIETPYTNLTMYDGRDACGGDGWRVDDVPLDEDKESITFLLSKLKPYTRYAYYVKTYTIASELSGAQSKIDYVRTLADRPSQPLDITVDATTSDALYISWKKPASPNGKVTHYIVVGTRREEDVDQLRSRDYCNSTQRYRDTTPKIEIKPPPKLNNTCDCVEITKSDGSKKLKNATDVTDQITFEDRLYNFVYIKSPISRVKEATRKKRHYEFPESKNNDDGLKNNTDIQNKTDTENKFTQFRFNVSGTQLEVIGLKHYTAYDINIQACREKEGHNDETFCSPTALLASVRTDKKGNADMVSNIVVNQTLGIVTVFWDKPSQPNGHILAYEIEYQMLDVDVAHASPYHMCVSAFDDAKVNNTTHTFTPPNRNPGNYSLRMCTRSQAGLGDWSDYVYFSIEEPSSKYIIIIVVFIIFLLLFIIGFCFFWYKRQRASDDIKLIASVNPEYVSTVYEPDDWEVPRDKIKLLKELGQGSFGMVYEGSAKDIKGKATIKCAIKTVNEHATNRERIEFLNEASVMKAFDTAHVVRLLGVVSQGQPTLVVMELMAHGDLKTYLRSHRPDLDSYDKIAKQPPTLKRILQMAIEIADGMAYLSAKKFVHRDLAARNCMVAEDLAVKIGDFGMTRDIYETDYYRKGTKGLLPVRWMAPESLKDGVFTSNSDVWSYGVVLWEMATLASQPYQGLSNDQVLRYVIDGGIMERPENCPDKLYDLMICCWKHKPSDRPSFLSLCSLLLEDATQIFCQVSFYHSAAGMEARNSRPSQSPSQDDPSTPLRGNQIDENFSLTSSDADSEQELEVESNIDFTSYPSMTKDVSSTANGYVGTRASNGTTT